MMNTQELDRLANKFAELSDCAVDGNDLIDILMTEYRQGKITKKELSILTYKLLTN